MSNPSLIYRKRRDHSSLLSLSPSTQWAIKGFPSPLILLLFLRSENISHQLLISITLQCVLYLLLPQLPPSSDQRCLLAQDQFVACWLTMGEDVGFSDPCPKSGTPSQGREGRERGWTTWTPRQQELGEDHEADC